MSEKQEPKTFPILAVGILLVVFGVVAIATPAVAGTAVVYVIGIVMLIAGVAQIFSGFQAEGWSHKLPQLILGAITTLAALGVLGHPLFGLTFLALLLAISFIVEGIWKICASFSYRPASGWIATLASGVISLLLGGLIWAQWPLSGLWAVGILVGVNFLSTGVSLLVLAMTIQSIAKEEGTAAFDSE